MMGKQLSTRPEPVWVILLAPWAGGKEYTITAVLPGFNMKPILASSCDTTAGNMALLLLLRARAGLQALMPGDAKAGEKELAFDVAALLRVSRVCGKSEA